MSRPLSFADFAVIVKCDLKLATFSIRGRPRLAVWICDWCDSCLYTRLPHGLSSERLLADPTALLPKPRCAVRRLIESREAVRK